MNIYMDLSFLLQICLGYASLYFTKILLVKKSKAYLEVIFILSVGFSIFLVYVSLIQAILIYYVFISIFLLLIFEKNYFKSLFLYFFCYSLLTFIIEHLSIYNSIYNFILVINSPKGMLSYLFAPLFIISLYLSVKLVDNLFHLHNYKTSCYLIKNDKKAYYTCYFDSGNTLKHNNIPVIFISKGKYIFEIEENEEIEIETINDIKKTKMERCLLSLEDKNESFYVYVILTDKIDFNGCEILLNAYLN